MVPSALLLIGLAHAGCPDVRDCQERASTWEDAAWFGVGLGWAGAGTAAALAAIPEARDTFNFGVPLSYGGFGLSVPLMAAAASPSRRAVELSGNPLANELRRRPRYWTMYVAGMASGGAALGLMMTDTGPWWVAAGLGIGAAGVLTGSAAGFARDARWIRRQAPVRHGKPRDPVRLHVVPRVGGIGLAGEW